LRHALFRQRHACRNSSMSYRLAPLTHPTTLTAGAYFSE
jgi:hypothetical protein